MKLREAVNRFLTKNLVGVRLIVPMDGRSQHHGEMILRMYSGDQAWMVYPEDFEKSGYPVYLIEAHDILDWEVSEKTLMIGDQDTCYVDGTQYGLSDREKVTIVRVKGGDASPFPVIVKFKNGAEGQYKVKELRMIVKSKGGAHV